MNELYAVTIFPIELFYKYVYLSIVSFAENYGLALIALSLLNYFLLLPLNKLVRGLQESENNIQQILEPQLKAIKETSQKEERHQRIQNLYERYSYHPIFAIRNVFPLLVQIPFLMAVYFMVSALTNLEGVGFLFLQDLSKPDGMMFGYNIMPVIMTIVSLVNACFIVKLSKAQKKQAIIVTLIFFILLYNAPSALLLYWTMNNIIILFFGTLSKVSVIEKVRLPFHAIKQHLFPSLIESSGLLLALCFVVPLFFTISLNVNFFSEAQIVNFTTFSAVVLCVSLLIGSLLDKIIKVSSQYSILFALPCRITIKKNAEKKPASLRINIKLVIYAVLALFAMYCMTGLCINIRAYISNPIAIHTVRFAFALLLFFILIKFSIKKINISFFAMLIFCCIQFAHKYYKNNQANERANTLITKAYNAFPMDTKLINKPNIYLVYLESYMSSTTLRTTYNYDNSYFEGRLIEQGFQLHDNLYSHGAGTKISLLTLLQMSENVLALSANSQDVSSSAHDILSGSEQNLLFRYLKSNDYNISSYYDSQNYYFKSKGKLLDHIIEDVDNSLLSVLRAIAPSLTMKIDSFRKIVFNEQARPEYIDIYPKTFQHISDINSKAHPSLFIIKPLNELHFNYNYRDLLDNYQKWVASGVYQQGIDKMNKELLTLINVIEDNDPNALIVLLGDHGHRYSDAAGYLSVYQLTPNEIKAKFPQFNMSSQEFIDDMYSVFFAIKMPKNAKGKLQINSHYAYADLFRYIFAALDNNPIFLENKSENISFNSKGIILRRDDKIFEDGEKAK